MNMGYISIKTLQEMHILMSKVEYVKNYSFEMANKPYNVSGGNSAKSRLTIHARRTCALGLQYLPFLSVCLFAVF